MSIVCGLPEDLRANGAAGQGVGAGSRARRDPGAAGQGYPRGTPKAGIALIVTPPRWASTVALPASSPTETSFPTSGVVHGLATQCLDVAVATTVDRMSGRTIK